MINVIVVVETDVSGTDQGC